MPVSSWRDGPQRGVQLVAAVAAERAQGVPGQALAVHAHEHVVLAEGVALDDGHVVLAVPVVPEADDVEGAEDAWAGRPPRRCGRRCGQDRARGTRGRRSQADELVVGEVPDARLVVAPGRDWLSIESGYATGREGC